MSSVSIYNYTPIFFFGKLPLCLQTELDFTHSHYHDELRNEMIPYFVAHLQVFSSQFKWNVWIIFWSIPVL